MFLPLHFEPGWPSEELPNLEWARVTGRFDHPAAEECAGDMLGPAPAEACRSHFVVTAVSRIPEP